MEFPKQGGSPEEVVRPGGVVLAIGFPPRGPDRAAQGGHASAGLDEAAELGGAVLAHETGRG